MKYAVVISHNWKTEETMHTQFQGDGAADKAAGWAHKESFLWRDFPAKDGWTHFAHWDEQAGEERGARRAAELMQGRITETVPT